MQKGLCYAALAIAIIVLVLFFADFALGMAGLPQHAPFKFSSLMIDIVFLICAGILAWMSWITLKEQV